MRRFVLAAGLLHAAASVQAQVRVVVSDVGPGAGGRIVQEALQRPHRLIEPDTSWFVLRRSETVRSSVIVLGRTAAIAGKVDGDVIVVGGDLFVRPGAEISGRGVAVGGGVYPSSLSFVGQGTQSFRDNTFDVARTADGYRLAYRSLREDASPPLLFPYVYGLRFPTYDRVNGASVPFGPQLTFAGGRGVADLLVTYRSDLGKFDPGISASFDFTRRFKAKLDVSQGTFSNDNWIWPHYVNSLAALTLGTDTRNYFRARLGELTIHRLWEFTSVEIEPYVGLLLEDDWSVGPGLGEQRGPWSAWRRTDSLGMWRPNPAIQKGDFGSVIGGGRIEWEADDLKLSLRSHVESDLGATRQAGSIFLPIDYQQITSDLQVAFLTFGEQEYQMEVHWVTTRGDTPPPQRFVYLGGSGTMPFLDLLSQGGDELLLVDQRYAIPLVNVRVGIFGVPTIQLRHRVGSAGLAKLPTLEQMLGAGVSLTVIRGEVQMDPATRKVHLTAGFTFSR